MGLPCTCDEYLRRYEAWLIGAIQDSGMRARFETLRNKILGCWCEADEACHDIQSVDWMYVIIRMLDELQPGTIESLKITQSRA